MRDRVVAERERIGAALAALPGVQVIPSGTNFVLVQLDRPKADVLHHLHHRHSLLISDMAAYPELVNCVRISVGTPAQNDLVIQGFGEVLGGFSRLKSQPRSLEEHKGARRTARIVTWFSFAAW